MSASAGTDVKGTGTATTPSAAPRRDRAEARRRRVRFTVALMLIGALVMLYPVGATLYNNQRQREFAARYNHEVNEAPVAKRSAALDAARAYNRSFEAVPILDPWLSVAKRHPDTSAYGKYAAQLSDLSAMARLRVPTASIDLPVYHDTTEEVLAKGVGHMYGTSLPVGGTGSHAVLTSHTGFANATLFDHLNKVTVGDKIYVDVYGETLVYQVDQIKVVLPNEIGDLTADPGQDLMTLFTCTPYAVNSHRLLVRGHRIPFEPPATAQNAAAMSNAPTLEPWMWLMIGGSFTSLALMVVILVRNRRRPAPPAPAGAPPAPPLS